MAKSAPDYYSSVSIAGKFGDNLIPVKVDVNGQMYVAMTGQTISVGNLPVDYIKAGDNVTVPTGVGVTNLPADYFKTGENIGNVANMPADYYKALQDLGRVKGDESGTPRFIAVDALGVMLARMKGAYGGVLNDIRVDDTGIMLSRMKGAANGDLILKILDDCGDTSTITNWVESVDALNPVDNQVYVKQGSHSMALGIDADLNVSDIGLWTNSQAQGDLSGYQHDFLYLWLYFPTLDYLSAEGVGFSVRIGSDYDNRIEKYVYKTELSIGWNLIKFDLDNPDVSAGNINWASINYIRIYVGELTDNINDFTVYVDSIMFVRPTPGAGTLKDIAFDENGIMFSKMTGQYAGLLKPLAIDENGLMLAKMTGLFNSSLKTIAVDTDGVMKANLSAQDLKPLRVMPFYGGAERDGSSVGVVTATDTELKLVEGVGIILGGFWYWTDTESAKTAICSLLVDGVVIAYSTTEGLDLRNINVPDAYPIFITQYDDTTWKYTVCLTKGIPFDTSVALHFYHAQGHNVSVTWEFVWSEVT